MKAIKTALLTTSLCASVVFGFWISYSRNIPVTPSPEPEPIKETQTPTPPKDDYTTPSFQFTEPFDPRAALESALAIEDKTERYGRLIAIGYLAAQNTPEENLAILSPEIWTYSNYDLRGAFHAEWMRSAPDTFLPFAETKYQELSETNNTHIFPVFHLAYMEPLQLLKLLPKIEHQKLKIQVRNELLGTLIELNPNLLWEHRSEIATVQRIVNEATNKDLYDLALHFWELSEWEELHFNTKLMVHIAKNQRLDHASHLHGYEKTRFANLYAIEHPATAATWIRNQSTFQEIEYEFDTEHSPFFSALFATESFSAWSDAPRWILAGINSDYETQNTRSLFAIIQASPDACHLTDLKESFTDYLPDVENHEHIKNLYLALDNEHPILEPLEQFLLHSSEDFSDALIARTTREAPTPERLMQVLALGNTDSWPDAYFAAARDTLNSLNDDELLWSLSPNMILAAQELAPERIQRIMATADSHWIANTLNSSSFIHAATLETLDRIPELVRELPIQDAQRIIDSARRTVLRESVNTDNKLKYLQIAQTREETLFVASGISITSYQSDAALRSTIEENPHRDEIYLSLAIAAQFQPVQTADPNIQTAIERIATARELNAQGQSAVVSTIQSLPSEERFLTAKAVLMTDRHFTAAEEGQALLDLSIWTASERDQLKNIGFKQSVNYNINHSRELIW